MENPFSPDIWARLHQGHQTLTDPQEAQFLRAASQTAPSTFALCETLFFTGCRLSEALALKRAHMNTESLFLAFRTLKQRSQDKWRAVPVPESLIARLYALPETPCGRFWPFSRWTARRRLLPVYEAAGLFGSQASSRAFRHSYNARAMRNGIPERVSQALLGHRTAAANRRYGQLAGYELRDFAALTWKEAAP